MHYFQYYCVMENVLTVFFGSASIFHTVLSVSHSLMNTCLNDLKTLYRRAYAILKEI